MEIGDLPQLCLHAFDQEASKGPGMWGKLCFGDAAPEAAVADVSFIREAHRVRLLLAGGRHRDPLERPPAIIGPGRLQKGPAQMLGKSLPLRGKLRELLLSEEFIRAIDAAIDAFAGTHDLSPLRGDAPQNRRRKEQAVPEEAAPLPPPPVTVDFARLPEIRAAAREMTERLIVEEEEPVGAATKPPVEIMHPISISPGGLQATPTATADSLRDTLTSAQAAIVDYLCTGEGAPPLMDELTLEGINEVALDVLGDTLIDMDEDVPYVYEEYVTKWKEGAL